MQISKAAMLYSMEKPCQDLAIFTTVKILKMNEDHPGALMQMALIKKDRGETAEATKMFIQLLTRDQDNSQLKYASHSFTFWWNEGSRL